MNAFTEWVVEHRSELLFYEIEAEKAGWSVPHLERQIHTLLFARLLKSRAREGVLALSRKGHALWLQAWARRISLAAIYSCSVVERLRGGS